MHQEGAGGATAATSTAMTHELENSMKLVETISHQKKAVEVENEELRSRISDLVNEKMSNMASNLDQLSVGGMTNQQ